MALLSFMQLLYLSYFWWSLRIKKSIVLYGAVGIILKYFTSIMTLNLLFSLTLFTSEILIAGSSPNSRIPLTASVILEIRQAIEYVGSYSEMACVYIFFFKLKQVEI